jgi:hypothetical protein
MTSKPLRQTPALIRINGQPGISETGMMIIAERRTIKGTAVRMGRMDRLFRRLETLIMRSANAQH